MNSYKDRILEYIKAEKYIEARVILTRHVSDLSKETCYLLIKAEIELGLERYDDAYNSFVEALHHDKDSGIAKAGLLRLADYVSITESQDRLFEDIKMISDPEVCLAKAAYFCRKGKLADAVRVLSDAFSLYDDDLRILSEYINVSIMNNIDDPVIEDLFEYTDLEAFPSLLEKKMLFLYKKEDYSRCEHEAKHIVTYHPGTSEAQRAYEILRKLKNKRNRSCETDYKELDAQYNSYRTESNSIEELNELVGLNSVKHEINRIIRKVEFDNSRKEILGIQYEATDCYHFVFTGNPGTGKTTVARLLADIFHDIGLLTSGQMVEVERADLVGTFQGQTALRTEAVIADALGGVLFIDEAYSLTNGASDDFGREAIDTLVKGMEDYRNQFVVILAGYTDEMRQLIDSNVGLESRFTTFIDFPDYTDDELLDIAKGMAAKQHYRFSREGEIAFKEKIRKKQFNRKFGNARAVRTIMSEAYTEKALRYDETKKSFDYLTSLFPEDFGIELTQKSSEVASAALERLEKLTGLQGVKYEIMSTVRMVDYLKHEKEDGRSDSSNMLKNLNLCFEGNPGTGKTTVARIYADVLSLIGVARTNEVLEVSRVDFVGRYQGETAIKTKEVCERSYGGVLFIDEAYSLIQGENDSFGKEAISTLIKQMEDNRDKMIVLFAGYPGELETFLDSNSGIRSRIAKTIEFPDYSVEELFEIFCSFIKENSIIVDAPVLNEIHLNIEAMYNNRDKDFGNARAMRSLFDAIWKNMVNRVESAKLTGDARRTFLLEDVM